MIVAGPLDDRVPFRAVNSKSSLERLTVRRRLASRRLAHKDLLLLSGNDERLQRRFNQFCTHAIGFISLDSDGRSGSFGFFQSNDCGLRLLHLETSFRH